MNESNAVVLWVENSFNESWWDSPYEYKMKVRQWIKKLQVDVTVVYQARIILIDILFAEFEMTKLDERGRVIVTEHFDGENLDEKSFEKIVYRTPIEKFPDFASEDRGITDYGIEYLSV